MHLPVRPARRRFTTELRSSICLQHSGNYSTLIQKISSRFFFFFYLGSLTVKIVKECTSIPVPVASDPLPKLIIMSEGARSTHF